MPILKYFEGYVFKTKDNKDAIIKKRENANKILIYIKDTNEEFYVKSFQITENTILSNSALKYKYGLGSKHKTNYGEIEIVGMIKDNTSKRKIKFINTGYEVVVWLTTIKAGEIKDLLAPTIYEIACFGEGDARGKTREYGMYHNMISRCYNKNDKNYDIYGGCGVRVDTRWLNYQNFAEDIKELENYNKWIKDKNYSLDKDVLQQGFECKIYSKDTCKFIKQKEQCFNLKKDIICYLNDKPFKNFKDYEEASKFLNISKSSIAYRVRFGKYKTNLYYNGKILTFKQGFIKNNKYIKKILQFDLNENLIKEWGSARVASLELGLSLSGIYGCCREKQKTTGGFIFKFKE